MRFGYYAFLFLCFACSAPIKIAEPSVHTFPVVSEKVKTLPAKEQFYIYLLAGQSNMAGRGFVQPQDTLFIPQVLALNKNDEWVYAKEPLHYYEPVRTGLDCGLSFGRELSRLYGDKITIGIVPCAIGGSSIEQWLGDSTYRNVTLYSNFLHKAKEAAKYGVIKGLLWHQGESNAGAESHVQYKQKLQRFFTKLRNDLHLPALHIYTGPLASFLTSHSFPYKDEVNKQIIDLTKNGKNLYLIKTSDLSPLKDTIHFNSPSQRLMGKRFAQAVFKNGK